MPVRVASIAAAVHAIVAACAAVHWSTPGLSFMIWSALVQSAMVWSFPPGPACPGSTTENASLMSHSVVPYVRSVWHTVGVVAPGRQQHARAVADARRRRSQAAVIDCLRDYLARGQNPFADGRTPHTVLVGAPGKFGGQEGPLSNSTFYRFARRPGWEWLRDRDPLPGCLAFLTEHDPDLADTLTRIGRGAWLFSSLDEVSQFINTHLGLLVPAVAGSVDRTQLGHLLDEILTQALANPDYAWSTRPLASFGQGLDAHSLIDLYLMGALRLVNSYATCRRDRSPDAEDWTNAALAGRTRWQQLLPLLTSPDTPVDSNLGDFYFLTAWWYSAARAGHGPAQVRGWLGQGGDGEHEMMLSYAFAEAAIDAATTEAADDRADVDGPPAARTADQQAAVDTASRLLGADLRLSGRELSCRASLEDALDAHPYSRGAAATDWGGVSLADPNANALTASLHSDPRGSSVLDRVSIFWARQDLSDKSNTAEFGGAMLHMRQRTDRALTDIGTGDTRVTYIDVSPALVLELVDTYIRMDYLSEALPYLFTWATRLQLALDGAFASTWPRRERRAWAGVLRTLEATLATMDMTPPPTLHTKAVVTAVNDLDELLRAPVWFTTTDRDDLLDAARRLQAMLAVLGSATPLTVNGRTHLLTSTTAGRNTNP